MNDTDQVFEEHTISGIHEFESQIQNDVERKKEDLRQMVGERYRDLIDAADTINAMKDYSGKILDSLGRIKELCGSFDKQVHVSTKKHAVPSIAPSQGNSDIVRRIGSLLALLSDMMPAFWNDMQDEKYLSACRYLLLGRAIVDYLQSLKQQKQYQHIINKFPIISNYSVNVLHLKTVIIQECNQKLKDPAASDQTVSECILVMLYIRDSSVRQIFTEFLLARNMTLNELLTADEQSSKYRESLSRAAKLVLNTIRQLYYLFCSTSCVGLDEGNSLSRLNGDFQNKNFGSVLGNFRGRTSACLPDFLATQRPTLSNGFDPLDVGQLQETCRNWLQSCKETVHNGVKRIFAKIRSIKLLNLIRTDLLAVFSTEIDPPKWSALCKILFENEVNLWEEFFHVLFIARSDDIITTQVQKIFDTSREEIKDFLANKSPDSLSIYDADVSAFVWKDPLIEFNSSFAWIPANQKTIEDGENLAMKALGFTPFVKSLSFKVNEQLNRLLQDAGYSLEEQEGETKTTSIIEKMLTENFKDSLKRAATDHLKRFCLSVQSLLTEAKSAIDSATCLDKILLVGRFCASLLDLAPTLVVCLTKQQNDSAKAVRRPRMSKTEDPEFSQIQGLLWNCFQDAIESWSSMTVTDLCKTLRESIEFSFEESCIFDQLAWEEVTVKEESDEGNAVLSKIRVPYQISAHVQHFLFSLCLTINKISAHRLEQNVMDRIVSVVARAVLEIYSQVVSMGKQQEGEKKMHQHMALQLLFDVKFFELLLSRKDANEGLHKKFASVIEEFESLIDPFDLDVFSPYMQSNLMKYMQRNQTLLGVITPSTHPLTAFSSSSQTELHNIIPLAQNIPKFSLLPLSNPTLEKREVRPLENIVSQSVPAMFASESHHRPRELSSNPATGSFYSKWFS